MKIALNESRALKILYIRRLVVVLLIFSFWFHRATFSSPWCTYITLHRKMSAKCTKIAKKFFKLNQCRCRCSCKSDTILLLATVVSVLLGIITGVCLKNNLETPLNPREIAYLKFPGELFVRMLKLLILPLMFSSLINSLANLDTTTASRLGLFAGLYYFVTIILAVATGIVLVLTIKPGNYSRHTGDVADVGKICKGTLPADTILDLFRYGRTKLSFHFLKSILYVCFAGVFFPTTLSKPLFALQLLV